MHVHGFIIASNDKTEKVTTRPFSNTSMVVILDTRFGKCVYTVYSKGFISKI